jgi:hypothetical protein
MADTLPHRQVGINYTIIEWDYRKYSIALKHLASIIQSRLSLLSNTRIVYVYL